MLIDFHTHFFPDRLFDALWRWFEAKAWPIRYKKYADDLITVLKGEGVTRAVSLHYPHKPGLSPALNDFTHRFSKKYPDLIIPFGSVHPDDTDKENELKRIATEYKFRGIKIHCHVQKVAPDDPRMLSIYKVCTKYIPLILIHCGTGPSDTHLGNAARGSGYGFDVSPYSGVTRISRIAKQFPEITFIIPHLGFDEIEKAFELLDTCPNIYLDTAMALSGFFKAEIRREWLVTHQDRLLYGSDFPHIPYPYNREIENIKAMKLGREIEEKIFYKNAIRLLR